jgi:hypothetical protein
MILFQPPSGGAQGILFLLVASSPFMFGFEIWKGFALCFPTFTDLCTEFLNA